MTIETFQLLQVFSVKKPLIAFLNKDDAAQKMLETFSTLKYFGFETRLPIQILTVLDLPRLNLMPFCIVDISMTKFWWTLVVPVLPESANGLDMPRFSNSTFIN